MSRMTKPWTAKKLPSYDTNVFFCVHGFAIKLLCDMIVKASDVNERNTRNIDSLWVDWPIRQ